VLVYTSDPVENELEVTGPVTLILFASSDAPDTDFMAKLIDVHPDGYAQIVVEGVVRARYRDSSDSPKLMTDGEVYKFTIDMVATSHVFMPNHRLRLDITSSNFPRYDRNLNTGEAFGSVAVPRIAKQTVYHNEAHPSHILL